MLTKNIVAKAQIDFEMHRKLIIWNWIETVTLILIFIFEYFILCCFPFLLLSLVFISIQFNRNEIRSDKSFQMLENSMLKWKNDIFDDWQVRMTWILFCCFVSIYNKNPKCHFVYIELRWEIWATEHKLWT